MPKTARERPPQRTPLSRDRVLRGAVEIADVRGIAALTIRSLAEHLGVKPMAVYHHVANKDEILDGIVDLVFDEIELPAAGDWRAQLRQRARSAHRVLKRHPWAIGLMRTTPGPANLSHHDAITGILRGAGFSVEMTAHAYALIDSYVYGFALLEASLPFKGPNGAAVVTDQIMQRFAAGEYPHLVEMATEYVMRPGYDFGNSFEFGLNMILDALDKATPGSGTELPT